MRKLSENLEHDLLFANRYSMEQNKHKSVFRLMLPLMGFPKLLIRACPTERPFSQIQRVCNKRHNCYITLYTLEYRLKILLHNTLLYQLTHLILLFNELSELL